MEFSIKSGSPEKQRSGCVVVGVYEGRKLSASAQSIDAASGQYLSEVLRRGDLEGSLGKTLLLHNVPKIPADRVLLVGLGRERDFNESAYRNAVSAAGKALKGTGASDATVCLTDLSLKRHDTGWKVEHAVLGLVEASYRFDRMKSKPPEAKKTLRKVTLHVARRSEIPAGETAIARGTAIAEGISLAKDLGNLPGNHCTPAYLAEQAVELGKRLRPQGRGAGAEGRSRSSAWAAFLAVARGSRQPPKLIVLRVPRRQAKTRRPSRWSARASPSTPAASRSSPRPRWTR